MEEIFTTRLIYIRVAIFAASVWVALLSSRSCDASCGEYVFSRFHTPAQHRSVMNQETGRNNQDIFKSEFSHLRKNRTGSSGATPALPTPCHGPNCSQNPTPMVPVAPQTTVGSSSQDRLIFGHPTMELPSDMSPLEDMQSDARARRGYPLLIEMPPEIAG